MVDYVGKWTVRAELPAKQLLGWIGLPISKYHLWRQHYGRPHAHNAHIPRDGWLEAPVSTSRRISLQISMSLCTPVPLSVGGCGRGYRPDPPLPENCTVVRRHFGPPRHGPRVAVFDRRQQRVAAGLPIAQRGRLEASVICGAMFGEVSHALG